MPHPYYIRGVNASGTTLPISKPCVRQNVGTALISNIFIWVNHTSSGNTLSE